MSDDNKSVPTSDEVRAKVIEEYGFDSETQVEQIEKLTNERLDNQKKLSKTIEQKTKYRNLAVENKIIDKETFEVVEKKPEGDKEIIKNNVEQSGLSREEVIFFAKGGSEEDFEIAKKISVVEGISLSEAIDNDYYKAKVEERKNAKKNQLGASSGSNSSNDDKVKPIGEMTEAEHRAYLAKKVPGIR